jgi:hypothetical protein
VAEPGGGVLERLKCLAERALSPAEVPLAVLGRVSEPSRRIEQPPRSIMQLPGRVADLYRRCSRSKPLQRWRDGLLIPLPGLKLTLIQDAARLQEVPQRRTRYAHHGGASPVAEMSWPP